MTENLFSNLEHVLAPLHRSASMPRSGGVPGCPVERQSFSVYRRSRPARQTAIRHSICLSCIGELSVTRQRIVAATADYLAAFFDLPVRSGVLFDPASFSPRATRAHPARGHPQLVTGYLLHEALWLDRPEEALICLGVTADDLCSDDYPGGKFGSVFGEAVYGHAAVWSLRHLGDPDRDDDAFRRCLRRSCAVATHEALHVLGLDHCDGPPCNLRGSACLSGPLHLCPPCLRKLCWNRQLELLPYLQRLSHLLSRWQFSEESERYASMMELVGGSP